MERMRTFPCSGRPSYVINPSRGSMVDLAECVDALAVDF